MGTLVYKEFVKEWETNRGLKGAERPTAGAWLFMIGKGVNQQIFRVKNQDDLERVETVLRQMENTGDKKNAHSVNADAVFSTYEREPTPPVAEVKASKAKKTSRPTPLQPSESEGSELGEDDVDNTPPKSKARRKRASATTRQLDEKKQRDASTGGKRGATQQKIHSKNQCGESNCKNKNGVCYVTKSNGRHGKVTLSQQEEWADMLDVGVEGVTLETPPQEWVNQFVVGWQDTGFRRRGTRKADTTTPVIAIKEEQISLPGPQVNNYYGAAPGAQHPPTMMPPMFTAPAPPPYYSQSYNPYQYMTGAPPQTQAPPPTAETQHVQPRRRPPKAARDVPAPSSPIQGGTDGEEMMERYQTFTLQGEVVGARFRAIKAAFVTVVEHFLTIEDMRGSDGERLLERAKIPIGIAKILANGVSAFKSSYKIEQKENLARNLLSLRHTLPESPKISSSFRREMNDELEEEYGTEDDGEQNSSYFENF